MHNASLPLSVIGASLLCLALPASALAADTPPAPGTDHAALIRSAFDDWRHGRGSVFDLLADDAVWTVAGSSPVSGTYRSRQALIDGAVAPIHARLSTPIVPDIRHIIVEGDEVIVIWDGAATARDGSPHTNSYAWHLVLENGRIVRVTAFLDTWTLDALMK